MSDESGLRNVRNELELLEDSQKRIALHHPRLAALKASLAEINARLWDIEDDIRVCENNDDFGQRFIALARSVYKTNDQRAALKLEINRLFNSTIVEEKSYTRLIAR